MIVSLDFITLANNGLYAYTGSPGITRRMDLERESPDLLLEPRKK